MAKLSDFRINSKAIDEGEWISPGEEYSDLMIKTKGFTDQYVDARAAKMRRAAQPYGNDVNKVPTKIIRDVTIELLIKYVLLDVKNIVDDSGKPINFAQFAEMLHQADYYDLVMACIKAAAVVGARKLEDLDEAKKNSPKPSA